MAHFGSRGKVKIGTDQSSTELYWARQPVMTQESGKRGESNHMKRAKNKMKLGEIRHDQVVEAGKSVVQGYGRLPDRAV